MGSILIERFLLGGILRSPGFSEAPVRGYATGKERPSSNVELTVKADASKPISDIQEPVQSLTQTLKPVHSFMDLRRMHNQGKP
jgi:hypothetical protein